MNREIVASCTDIPCFTAGDASTFGAAAAANDISGTRRETCSANRLVIVDKTRRSEFSTSPPRRAASANAIGWCTIASLATRQSMAFLSPPGMARTFHVLVIDWELVPQPADRDVYAGRRALTECTQENRVS